MITVLLTMLFVFSGVFALATIADSCRRYGAAALAIGREHRLVQPGREVRVTTRLIEVQAVATILRPDFRNGRQSPSAALPVAA